MSCDSYSATLIRILQWRPRCNRVVVVVVVTNQTQASVVAISDFATLVDQKGKKKENREQKCDGISFSANRRLIPQLPFKSQRKHSASDVFGFPFKVAALTSRRFPSALNVSQDKKNACRPPHKLTTGCSSFAASFHSPSSCRCKVFTPRVKQHSQPTFPNPTHTHIHTHWNCNF